MSRFLFEIGSCASRSDSAGSAWTCKSTKYSVPSLRTLTFSIARTPATLFAAISIRSMTGLSGIRSIRS
jgi:hypothetical protein